jgi:hypothetical protein
MANNTNYCIACDIGFYSLAGECLPSSPDTKIVEIINYNLASSPYVSSIAALNTVFAAPGLNRIFSPVYFALPEAVGNIITI